MKQSASFRFSLAVLAGVLFLSGCQSLEGVFTDTKEPPLKGERISVLQLQKQLSSESVSSPVSLMPAEDSDSWPQAWGNPHHRPVHVALADHPQQAWVKRIGVRASKYSPLTVTPVVANNTVYGLDARGNLTATNLVTGDNKWAVQMQPEEKGDAIAVGGGLAYDQGRLYVTAGQRFLYAVNPDNGAKIWQVPLPTVGRVAPTVYGGRIYVVLMDNSLAVFSASDGSKLWSYSGVVETTSLLGAAPVAVDDTIVVLPMSSGEIFGLRPENGRVVWQDNLSPVGGASSFAISDIVGLPVIDNDIVFAISYGGKLVAIDKATGMRRWQREIGGTETPMVNGNSVFVMSDEQQFIALDRDTGAIRWVMQMKKFSDEDRKRPIVWSGPVLAGGRLWIVSNQNQMLEVSPQDGKVLKSHEIPTGSDVPPIAVAKTLLVLNQFGELMAWR